MEMLDFSYFYSMIISNHNIKALRIYNKGDLSMINFDEEIGKFQPSLEIEQAEDIKNSGN